MGLFSRKNKKVEEAKMQEDKKDIEISLEELDKVTAGIPESKRNADWLQGLKAKSTSTKVSDENKQNKDERDGVTAEISATDNER